MHIAFTTKFFMVEWPTKQKKKQDEKTNSGSISIPKSGQLIDQEK